MVGPRDNGKPSCGRLLISPRVKTVGLEHHHISIKRTYDIFPRIKPFTSYWNLHYISLEMKFGIATAFLQPFRTSVYESYLIKNALIVSSVGNFLSLFFSLFQIQVTFSPNNTTTFLN